MYHNNINGKKLADKSVKKAVTLHENTKKPLFALPPTAGGCGASHALGTIVTGHRPELIIYARLDLSGFDQTFTKFDKNGRF